MNIIADLTFRTSLSPCVLSTSLLCWMSIHLPKRINEKGYSSKAMHDFIQMSKMVFQVTLLLDNPPEDKAPSLVCCCQW